VHDLCGVDDQFERAQVDVVGAAAILSARTCWTAVRPQLGCIPATVSLMTAVSA
jgi:hypothetical protein